MSIGTFFTLVVLPSIYMLVAKDHSKERAATEEPPSGGAAQKAVHA
jgi:hypothetical protein